MRWTATMILFNIQKLHIFNNLKIIETLLRHTLLFLKPQKFRSIKKKNGCLLNSCEVYPHDSDLTVFLSTKNELKKFFSNPPVKIVFVSQKKKKMLILIKRKNICSNIRSEFWTPDIFLFSSRIFWLHGRVRPRMP